MSTAFSFQIFPPLIQMNANDSSCSPAPPSFCKTPFSLSHLGIMVPDLVRPGVTEIQVRMDCNGCIQKIKKALHGVNGIYDVYIDLPQQKLTVIGWADPQRIVNAIRKTRKIATICSYTEPTQPSAEPTEEAPQEGAPPIEEPNPPPPDMPPEEHSPPEQPPQDPPPVEVPPPQEDFEPPPPENSQLEAIPVPTLQAADLNAGEPSHSFRSRDVGEAHPMYQSPPYYAYSPPDYGYRLHGYRYPEGIQQPPRPIYVNHSYNTTRLSPYVTEFEYMPYGRADYNSTEEYHNSNGNITSMFSDENPNSCSIM